MKTLAKLVLIVGLILGATSCSDYIELDLDNLGGGGGSSELVGTWDITSMKMSTFQSEILQEQTEETAPGTLTFNRNGSGSYSITSVETNVTESGSFDWFESDDKVIMNFLTLSDSVTSDNIAIAWEVIQGSSTTQEWMADFSYYSEREEDPYGNYVDPTEYLMRYEIRAYLRKQ
ncbi:MAG: hypothetical protein PHN67_10310 [Bacteroidales bacterium]|nr:hypothetical protein [Bacteroidales bacterium]